MIKKTINPKLLCRTALGGIKQILFDDVVIENELVACEYKIITTNTYSLAMVKMSISSNRFINSDFNNILSVKRILCVDNCDNILILDNPICKIIYQSGKDFGDLAGAYIRFHSKDYKLKN